MNESFWDGFEKQAGLMQTLGNLGGRMSASVVRGGARTALMAEEGRQVASGIANKARGAVNAVASAPSRAAAEMREGFHTAKSKSLNIPRAQYDATRAAAVGRKNIANAPKPAPRSSLADRPSATPNPQPGALQRAAAAAKAHPVATAAGVGAAGAGAGYLAGHRQPQQQGQVV